MNLLLYLLHFGVSNFNTAACTVTVQTQSAEYMKRKTSGVSEKCNLHSEKPKLPGNLMFRLGIKTRNTQKLLLSRKRNLEEVWSWALSVWHLARTEKSGLIIFPSHFGTKGEFHALVLLVVSYSSFQLLSLVLIEHMQHVTSIYILSHHSYWLDLYRLPR